MLITFSGIVGGGKSTSAKHAYHLLHEWGYPVVYLRFRSLTLRKILRGLPDKRKSAASAQMHQQTPKRRADKRLRCQRDARLTLMYTLGYLWRMIIFRILVLVWLRRKIAVLDRFYYDSFAHYTLAGPLERIYFAVLKKMSPTPDLALMLTAMPQTILRRRPHYDGKYVHRLHQHYAKIMRAFPRLVVLKTDSFEHLTETIEQHIRGAVAAAGNMGT